MSVKASGNGLRQYRAENVLEMALRRLDWLFDEFGRNVMVSVSGGKDSTVVFHLALHVAREKGLLPLKVFWIDQEAEWQATVDIVESWMTHPDVEPVWLQVPFRISNATSTIEHYLHAWDPEREADWIHPKHPAAVTENVFGVDRFHDLFPAATKHFFGKEPCISITGVRAEEAPTRAMGLTHYATYKWITWGSWQGKPLPHYTFHPLYDWHFADVWHFIATWNGGVPYNHIYDRLWSYGKHVKNMRVSNLHHETAVWSLFELQEIEPDTYDRLVRRIGGIDMAAKMGYEDYFPRQLPFMFKSWREYRDYLFDHLLDDDEKAAIAPQFSEADRKLPPELQDEACKVGVSIIMVHDVDGTKFNNWFHTTRVWDAQKRNRANWLVDA